MTDVTTLLSGQPMGTFDEQGNYVPRVVTLDDMEGTDLSTVVGNTVLEFEDGDLVEGIVRTSLESAVQLSVPLDVSLHWGENWAEAKG